MIHLPPSVHIFLCSRPADMRRSFDGLAAMTSEIVRADPMSGHLFVFCNRRKDRVKILFWDRSGYWILYKRLERGVFKFPQGDGSGAVEVEAVDLALLLEGIDLAGARRRARFVPEYGRVGS